MEKLVSRVKTDPVNLKNSITQEKIVPKKSLSKGSNTFIKGKMKQNTKEFLTETEQAAQGRRYSQGKMLVMGYRKYKPVL